MVLVSLKYILLCSYQSSWIKTKTGLGFFQKRYSLKICWNLQNQVKVVTVLQNDTLVWTRKTAQHPDFMEYQQWCRTYISPPKKKPRRPMVPREGYEDFLEVMRMCWKEKTGPDLAFHFMGFFWQLKIQILCKIIKVISKAECCKLCHQPFFILFHLKMSFEFSFTVFQ